MSDNKKHYSKTILDVASFANSLSHPARILILNILAKKGTCICGEIVKVLPLSQSTVSQHLKELKEEGIIKGTIDGAKSCYCIDWRVLNSKLLLIQSYTDKLIKLNKKIVTECC